MKCIATAVDKSEKRKTRSDLYQHKFYEYMFDSPVWNTFQYDPDRPFRITDEKREELLVLDDQLKKLIMDIITSIFTPRQLEIVIMYADGYTQMEIASSLGVNQSSITKSLHGNTWYGSAKNVRYGGVGKKIIKYIKNEGYVLKPIMKQIYETWEPESCDLLHYETIKRSVGSESEFLQWLAQLSPPPVIKKRKLNPIPTHQRLKMREDFAGGMRTQDIAAKYNFGVGQVKHAVKGIRRAR